MYASCNVRLRLLDFGRWLPYNGKRDRYMYSFLNKTHFELRHRRKVLGFVVLLCSAAVLFVVELFYGLNVRFLLTFLLVLFGIWPLALATLVKGSDIFSPNVLLPFTFMLYAIGPLDVSSSFSSNVINFYLLLQLVGLLAMTLGLHSFSGAIKQYPRPLRADKEHLSAFFLVMVLMLILSLLSVGSYLVKFGGIRGYLEIGYGADYFQALSEGGLIGSGFQWLMLFGGLCFFYGLMRNAKVYKTLGTITLILTSAIVLLTGRRRELIYPLIFCVVMYHYGRKRLPSFLVAICIFAGIVLSQYYALARSFLDEGLLYALEKVWPAVVKDPYILLPWASNEFRMPAASLLEVLEYGSPSLWGRSYITAVGAPIPFLARLFAKVGFDLNSFRLQTYYSGLLPEGAGLGFSPVTEAYMNFGFLGVAFVMYMYGLVISRIYRRLLKKPNLSNLLLYAGSIPVFMLEGLRGSSGTFMYTWFRVCLMPWFVFIAVRLFSSYKRTAFITATSSKMERINGGAYK